MQLQNLSVDFLDPANSLLMHSRNLVTHHTDKLVGTFALAHKFIFNASLLFGEKLYLLLSYIVADALLLTGANLVDLLLALSFSLLLDRI